MKKTQTGKRLRLDSMQDLRGIANELRTLYRMARADRMSVDDALKLSRVLRTLMECVALSEIETRLRALEGEEALSPMHPSIVASTGPIRQLVKGGK